ncbi:hypothetical protein GOP47_0006380 [Adiantum capillus-veneris]|uniref:Uncharacterized protein n=1 Tax=Adiantum capillus-veneris TaxID=13818 RepID=A0A9D4V357_ADICA|nr:hypothetical protein GOP47_0006380 [Adiantum capillus-veneris]
MKKPSSMATVISRTCPLCFTMVDPVWYGFHISMCNPKNSQDMGPSTTLRKTESHKSQLVVTTCKEASASLPEACTISLAPESQFVKANNRDENLERSPEVNERALVDLQTVKQALADKVKDLELQLEKLECQLSAEKQAFADKVKCLELKVEELECQLRVSKESERNALCLVEFLQGSLANKNTHINDADQCAKLLEITNFELKTFSPDKQSVENKNDEILPCDTQGKEVDNWNEQSDHSKVKVAKTILTKNVDTREEVELDCVVRLACTGGYISEDFLSQVDGVIESHKAVSSTKITSRMEDIFLEPSLNGKNGDPHHAIPATMGSQDSTKRDNVLFATTHNGSPSRVVVDEEHHTTPRDALLTSLSKEDSLTNNKADCHGVANRNGSSIEKMNVCEPHLNAQGAAIQMQFQTLDKENSIEGAPQVVCEEKSHAKEARSFSSSSSSELEVHVVKVKAGLRRIVLSDSESEDGDMQANCEGSKSQNTPNGADFRARDTCTENGIENGANQQSPRRSKQLKVVQSSDLLDDDREHTGARRSKRLRTLSQSKNPDIRSSKKRKFRCRVVASSSSSETYGHLEGLAYKRSKTPSRVRKRLFEEVESKPAHGDKHPVDSEDDDSEIESDSDSLKDFVVDSEGTEDWLTWHDEQSLSGSHSSRDAYCDPSLRRDLKIRNYVWEMEHEMLAAFAVNPELCLRAVCAINRRQTEDEQQEKQSKYLNKRGFNSLHAGRGTRIAEFLTNGDPKGPVKKSVEELKKFDAGGLGFCEMIATMHSRQLFETYTNAEDPYFPFS